MKPQNLIHILIGIVCFGLLPKAQAVSPPPDGGYAGQNTAEGQSALLHLAGGTYNTALGWASLGFNVTGNFNTGVGAATLLNNTADENTATGAGALLSNTTGGFNTANGAFALFSNTTGVSNTANGAQALQQNTTGFGNVANGAGALSSNSTGSFNTAVGDGALSSSIGDDNTASGYLALFSNTTGDDNTANGSVALQSNTTGIKNTANGANTLQSNTGGSHNTATGYQALNGNTVGGQNTANGVNALQSNTNGAGNTAIGFQALENNTSGILNIALGFNAGSNLTSGDNNIYIGSFGVATESDTIRIGTSGVQTTAFIRGIRGVTTGNNDAVPVLIDSAGQLGTTSSSRRFKKEIKPMDSVSEAILALKPVTFHYNSDKTNTPQFGLIAEEVAEVNPDLVVHDENGEIYTVRYDAVNAMLLNEFLKEHRECLQEQRKVQQLEANGAEQQKEINLLRSELKEQRALIQKVNDKVDLKRSAPQIVATD